MNKTYVIQRMFYKHHGWKDLCLDFTERAAAIDSLFKWKKGAALQRYGVKPSFRLVLRKTSKTTVTEKIEIE
jgi:hypothetical protein